MAMLSTMCGDDDMYFVPLISGMPLLPFLSVGFKVNHKMFQVITLMKKKIFQRLLIQPILGRENKWIL